MRQLVETPEKRAIARVSLHEFVEYLYDFVPEEHGRFVSGYGAWVPNATPLWVGHRIAQHFNHIFRRADDLMPKKTNDKKQAQRIEFEFVRGDMTAEQKAAAKVWIEKNGNDFETFLGDVLGSDYKLSLSYDDYNDTFVSSLTGKAGNKHNEGKILTGRGRTWYLALMSTLYKHYEIFQQGAWISAAPETDDFS